MFRPGIGRASPWMSVSIPAMIFSSVDLPEPFRPSTPIFAPGKKDNEMSFRIWRFGGTILPTRFMVKTYWAICGFGCLEVFGVCYSKWLRLAVAGVSGHCGEAPRFSTRRCVFPDSRNVPTLYFDG